MQSEGIEVAALCGSRLRIQFTWHNDRYGHVISLVNAPGQAEPLLESVEGASDDAWPPSPPLQSLSIEKLRDGRSAALLVGMAGRSHWSASVEPAAGQLAQTIDVACRHSHEPNWLGNRYRRLSAAAEQLSIAGDGIEISTGGPMVAIRPLEIASPAGTTRWKFTVAMPLSAARPAPVKAMEQRQ